MWSTSGKRRWYHGYLLKTHQHKIHLHGRPTASGVLKTPAFRFQEVNIFFCKNTYSKMFTINQFLVLTFFRLNEKYFFDNSKSLHKESVNLSVYLIFHYTESTKEKYPPSFFLSFGIGSKNLGICRIGS